MKTYPIGVNSAFATGTYHKALSLDDIQKIIDELPAKIYEKSELTEIFTQAQQTKLLYDPKFQSNFVLEFDCPGKRGKSPYRLMIDLGGDARHGLKRFGLTASDIDGVYITHCHNDHIGGMECQALMTIFNPFFTPQKNEWLGSKNIMEKLTLEQQEWANPPEYAKPDLFIHEKVLAPLRRALAPGLDTLQGVPNIRLETYFNIKIIGKSSDGNIVSAEFMDGERKWTLTPIFAMHVISATEEMASYGLKCSTYHKGEKRVVLFPSDAMYMVPPNLKIHYQEADVIYMDCETSKFPSGVHPHFTDLLKMDTEIQKKCLLYHYDVAPNDLPEWREDLFKGVLKVGDIQEY